MKSITWKFKLFGEWRLYIANHQMRNRNRQPREMQILQHEHFYLKNSILYRQKHRCAECGEEIYFRTAQLHHIIPRSMNPELRYDKDNCIALCPGCHTALHNNPYRMVEMIEQKKKELAL